MQSLIQTCTCSDVISHASLYCMCLKLYFSFFFGEKKTIKSLHCHKTEDTWWCKAVRRSVNTCPAELWGFAGVQQCFTDVSVDLWLFQSGKEDVSSHLTLLPAQTALCFICEWDFSKKDLFLFLWCVKMKHYIGWKVCLCLLTVCASVVVFLGITDLLLRSRVNRHPEGKDRHAECFLRANEPRFRTEQDAFRPTFEVFLCQRLLTFLSPFVHNNIWRPTVIVSDH